MSGTFRGTFNNSGNDSDRISEELFDAFNMDDYEEDRRVRPHGNMQRADAPKGSGAARRAASGKKRKRKDRQLIAMIGLCVLAFLLIAEILLGIFLFKIRALAVIASLILNLAIGLILGPCFIVAPILMAAVELAAGIFAGQWILGIMGVLLIAGGQTMCHMLK